MEGRIGQHRFHSMLVHFPAALYPFSFVMDAIGFYLNSSAFAFSGYCALITALGSSIIAIVYGGLDLLKIKAGTPTWRQACMHAFLNSVWFLVFSSLFLFRLKHPNDGIGLPYLIINALTLMGLFYSNYLGADLIIRHGVGTKTSDD